MKDTIINLIGTRWVRRTDAERKLIKAGFDEDETKELINKNFRESHRAGEVWVIFDEMQNTSLASTIEALREALPDGEIKPINEIVGRLTKTYSAAMIHEAIAQNTERTSKPGDSVMIRWKGAR